MGRLLNRVSSARRWRLHSRRQRKMFDLGGCVLGRGTGKQIARGLPHHQLAAGGGEDRHQADIDLGSADFVPRNPHAVARAQIRWTEMLRELFGREGVLAVGRLGVGCHPLSERLAVVVAIHHQLAFHGHCLVVSIVEVDPPAESPSGFFPSCIKHGGRPHGRQADRFGVTALGHLRRLFAHPALGPIRRLHGLATAEAEH
jgi:hypothetical protein